MVDAQTVFAVWATLLILDKWIAYALVFSQEGCGNHATCMRRIVHRRVTIDADLAELYDVPTKRLNEQIKRNAARFPSDFMFQLTTNEKAEVVANCDHLARLKFSPVLPYAFTEHGALMAANVLNSPRAVEASVYVIRAFVRLREVLATNAELAKKLYTLEKKLSTHDQAITGLINAIRQLTAPQTTKRRKIESPSTSG